MTDDRRHQESKKSFVIPQTIAPHPTEEKKRKRKDRQHMRRKNNDERKLK